MFKPAAECTMALIALLPQPTTVIDRWREKYDPAYGLIPAHLTILRLVPQAPAALKNDLLLACRGQKAFRLADGWGRFDGAVTVVYARVSDQAPIQDLRRRILGALPAGYAIDPPGYLAHVTVGRFADRRLAERAWAEISLHPLYLDTMIRHLIAAHCAEDGAWRIDEEITLRGEEGG